MSRRPLAVLTVVLFALAQQASASCPENADLPTFLNDSNAARALSEGWEDHRARTGWDDDQLHSAYRGGEGLGPRFAVSMSIDFRSESVDGYPVCRGGAELGTQFESMWAALDVSLEDTVSNWGARFSLFLPALGFFESVPDPAAADGSIQLVQRLGHSQAMVLGSAHVGDAVSVGLGYLGPRTLTLAPGVALPPGTAQSEGSGHAVLALGAPRLRLYSLWVLGGDSSPLDQARLSLRRYPVKDLPLDVSVELVRVAVEHQVYSTLAAGAHGPWSREWVPRVDLELTPEYNSPRLRYARLSASVDLDALGLREYAPLAPAWLHLGGFVRGSVFNSRYLEETTGVRGAWGWEAGGSLRVGIPVATLFLEGAVGRNRPDDLSPFPAAVDHPAASLMLGLRVAPWAVFGWDSPRGEAGAP